MSFLGSYSQCPQLGHVVEAGERDECDIVVVEGTKTEKRENIRKQCTMNTIHNTDILKSLILTSKPLTYPQLLILQRNINV